MDLYVFKILKTGPSIVLFLHSFFCSTGNPTDIDELYFNRDLVKMAAVSDWIIQRQEAANIYLKEDAVKRICPSVSPPQVCLQHQSQDVNVKSCLFM